MFKAKGTFQKVCLPTLAVISWDVSNESARDLFLFTLSPFPPLASLPPLLSPPLLSLSPLPLSLPSFLTLSWS